MTFQGVGGTKISASELSLGTRVARDIIITPQS